MVVWVQSGKEYRIISDLNCTMDDSRNTAVAFKPVTEPLTAAHVSFDISL